MLNIVDVFPQALFSLEFVTFIRESKVGKFSFFPFFPQMKCYTSISFFFFRFPEPGDLSVTTDTSASLKYGMRALFPLVFPGPPEYSHGDLEVSLCRLALSTAVLLSAFGLSLCRVIYLKTWNYLLDCWFP